MLHLRFVGALTIFQTGADRTEVKVGGVTFGLETGRLARLAAGAVVCDTGDTAVGSPSAPIPALGVRHSRKADPCAISLTVLCIADF